jgi:hypothetical protein
MIHRISIPARDPRHVASVLAELFRGRVYPSVAPGSYMAVAGDAHGTTIEVTPASTALEFGKDDAGAVFVDTGTTGDGRPAAGFHALLSVPREPDDIERIGTREGWRTQYLGRGVPGQPPRFYVFELWVENRLMLELVPNSMTGPYRRAVEFAALDRLFATQDR